MKDSTHDIIQGGELAAHSSSWHCSRVVLAVDASVVAGTAENYTEHHDDDEDAENDAAD